MGQKSKFWNCQNFLQQFRLAKITIFCNFEEFTYCLTAPIGGRGRLAILFIIDPTTVGDCLRLSGSQPILRPILRPIRETTFCTPSHAHLIWPLWRATFLLVTKVRFTGSASKDSSIISSENWLQIVFSIHLECILSKATRPPTTFLTPYAIEFFGKMVLNPERSGNCAWLLSYRGVCKRLKYLE